MPAADDLLVDSHVGTDRAKRFAGSLPESTETLASRRESWLCWLSELLKDTRGLALITVMESDNGATVDHANVSVTVTARTPASVEIPKAGLALARRAAVRASRQRLQLPGTDEVLLSLPLPALNATARESTVLLLLCGALSRQQQSTVLGLAAWAVKSARRWIGAVSPASTALPLQENALSEPLTLGQLVNHLGEHYPGSVCALHWMRAGRRGRRRSRVMAISGQGDIDHSGTAVRSLARSVELHFSEGSAQARYRVLDTASDQSVADTVEAELASWTSCLMMPFQVDGDSLVVALYWTDASRLSDADRARLQSALPSLVQCAWLQWRCGQNLTALLWQRWRSVWKRRLQGGVRTLCQAAALLFALMFLLWPVDKRLSAEVVVEAAERHALIAPLDGYVKSVHARAGDRVSKGELLARLDDEDLLRQVDKWVAEEQKNQQDHLSALATHDRVELSALRESRELIKAELERVRAQLARHELRAPVSGIVLGDAVEDALGSAVSAGKILFEVGSAEHHRLALQVPERRISEVEPGQVLSLRMAANPRRLGEARVETLIPVAIASQGQNRFKVYASPLTQAEGLRPGMKGVGKILVGRESRLMQWWNSLWTRCLWLAWKLGLVA